MSYARVAELVDALVLGTSGVTRESSSLSFRTNIFQNNSPLSRSLSENADFIQNKAKFGEKSQFTGVNEYFEPNFNSVMEEICILRQSPNQAVKPNRNWSDSKKKPIDPLQ